MRKRNLLLILAAVLVMLLALITSVNILPAPPTAPTPTWPIGVDLPVTLHRITQP